MTAQTIDTKQSEKRGAILFLRLLLAATGEAFVVAVLVGAFSVFAFVMGQGATMEQLTDWSYMAVYFSQLTLQFAVFAYPAAALYAITREWTEWDWEHRRKRIE